MPEANAKSCPFCFIDVDIDNHRSKLGLAASFVDATDSRYGFSSKDIRKLGGSELSRIEDLLVSDHEWGNKGGNGIEIRPPSHGNRIVIKLFWDVAPLACENFATLCTNGNNTLHGDKKIKPAPIGECGKPQSYKETIIHRIVPNFIVQGGDFVFGNGSGGESIYNGKKFKDERAGLQRKHDKRGIVSMGNSGKNSNTSQFFITFKEAPQCDGKHVVFGEMVSGFDVLEAIEDQGVEGSGDGKPSKEVKITDCGAFHPLMTAGAGFWYDQPDVDSFTGKTPVFMVRPRIAIIAATQAICDKFITMLGTQVTSTSIAIDSDGVGSEEIALQTAHTLLESFAIDVILIAPTNRQAFEKFKMPSSWMELSPKRTFNKEEVCLITKPIDALLNIQNQSWIGKESSYHLDGKI